MRFWEIGLIVVNFVLLGWTLFTRKRTKRWFAIALPVAYCVLIVQLIAEGYRWQMIPAYLSPIILTACYLLTKQKKNAGSWVSVAVKSLLLFIYLSVAVALPALMPVSLFQKPNGPFTVGTTLYHWVDDRREEPFAKDPKDRRELMVQIYYPAGDQGEGDREPYLRNTHEVAKGLEGDLSIPAFTLSHLGLVQTNAFTDARMSDTEKQYPVLLFSHGLNGFRNQNTFEVEELASQGYIVVSIDHAYDAAATVYPDGRTAYFQSVNLSDLPERDRHIQLWKDDVAFVLDQIEKLNRGDVDDRFTGRIDTSRIGMFGHSYGGATAAQMLVEDSRIKAAIDMDGTLYGSTIKDSGIGKPFLLMSAEMSDDSDEDSLEEKLRNKRALAGGGMSLVIPHTDHTSFTDFHLMSPLLRSPGEDPRYVHRIINEFSLAFFDLYVKQRGNSLELEKLATKYPEVHFKVN
ncbi:alpha/beta hydrolase family protein [Paenibacillus azoreducens]|uniref:Carboxylic ester hydrolase n=1 Tax=Paenibacillus azoreducens TaxID=116718 RepID=A0A919Y6D1_9BACL|nr:carboxylic ester hydrolase [Paenibacillus azoreducens]GIO45771.1 carboxylic ester hydrolase [Paenibacillus azoreducens]